MWILYWKQNNLLGSTGNEQIIISNAVKRVKRGKLNHGSTSSATCTSETRLSHYHCQSWLLVLWRGMHSLQIPTDRKERGSSLRPKEGRKTGEAVRACPFQDSFISTGHLTGTWENHFAYILGMGTWTKETVFWNYFACLFIWWLPAFHTRRSSKRICSNVKQESRFRWDI